MWREPLNNCRMSGRHAIWCDLAPWTRCLFGEDVPSVCSPLPGCPHCKNSVPHFTTAAELFKEDRKVSAAHLLFLWHANIYHEWVGFSKELFCLNSTYSKCMGGVLLRSDWIIQRCVSGMWMKPLDAIKLCTLLLKLQLHPVGEMNGSVSLQTKSARGGVDRNSLRCGSLLYHFIHLPLVGPLLTTPRFMSSMRPLRWVPARLVMKNDSCSSWPCN